MKPITNEMKRERLNRLSEDDYMRWAYVPFCVAAGVWDYADTIINIAAQMRLTETKKLCRAIRELKRAYDATRRRYAMTSSGHEIDNFMVMERNSPRSFRFMYDSIEASIQSQHPGLQDDYRQLLAAVYACSMMLDIMFRYTSIQEDRVKEICGFSSMSSILPDELRALRRLVPEFAGDKPVKVRGRGIFIHNITRALCAVELTSDKPEAV